jgi:hypothetical protein
MPKGGHMRVPRIIATVFAVFFLFASFATPAVAQEGIESTLYLRDKGALSEEMGTPSPWVTWYVYPEGQSRSTEWQTALQGDISGTFFYNIDIVESEGPATLKVEFIVNNGGTSTIVASQEISVSPLEPGYYVPKSASISGVDLQTGEQDFLTFRVTLTSGPKRVGIGLDGTSEWSDSYLKVSYQGLFPCFSVSPQRGDPYTDFSFDASCSSDTAFDTSDLEVRWDWENDGLYDTAFSKNKMESHQYPSSGIKHVKMQVRNPDGVIRTREGRVSVDLFILSSFNAPGPAPVGLAWDGSHLWFSDTRDDRIYKLTTSGSVVTSFPSPCGDPLDLAWDGEFLWVVDAWGYDDKGNEIYKVDTSGNVVTSFSVPTDISTGLTWDGHFLWGTDGTNGRIAKIDPESGEVVLSFASPGFDPRGLAWDGQYLWVADFTNQEIYQIDVNGSVLNTFPSPGTGPMGLTWDGENLWCADLDSYKVYELTGVWTTTPGALLPSTITCDLSAQEIVLGDRLTVSGQISPAPGEAGIGVSIEFISPDGTPVYRAALANIMGEFMYQVTSEDLDRSGTWTVRTSWAGRGAYESSASPETAFEVIPAETSLTLNASSQAVRFGELVDLSGKFTPRPDWGADLRDIPLAIHIFSPLGTSEVLTVNTMDRWGHYVVQDWPGFDALGEWTVQAVFAGNAAYLASSSKTLKVQVVETAGYAVIVQGRIESEEGLASHQKTAGFVYDQLRSRGLLEEDIKFFSYDTSDDRVDGTPTQSGVGNAVTQWARDKMNAKPANLYIVMVDHGFTDVFYIHPETISAADLASWLDSLQASLDGQAAEQEILVILGFCRSGSFINDLSVSNRVIISSAAANESSYKGPLDKDGVREGEYFVSEVFKQVAFGKSVKACFEAATMLTEQFTATGTGSINAPFYDDSRQHPLLDDNGDGAGSNDLSDPAGDGQLSESLFIGVSALTANDPGDVTITRVAPPVFLGEGESSADLWAQVDDNNRLDTIWIEVKPPGYEPVGAGGSGQVEMELQRSVYRVSNETMNRYEWPGEAGFVDPGTYQVFYFAKDAAPTGNVSPLKETRVYKAKAGNNPPGPFSLMSPGDGEEVLTTMVLDWEDTVDPEGDPFTYTVLVSKGDPGFYDPIRIEGLIYSTCLIGPSEGIEDLSEYYWKVLAIDRYGSIRQSEARMFHTNNTNPVVGWVRGHVYDAGTNASITGAMVSVGDIALNTGTGGYYLGQTPPGTYTMTASASGYNVGSHSGVEIGDGALVTKDFGLASSGADDQGDINNDGAVDLADAILAIKVLAGIDTSGLIRDHDAASGTDVDGDDQIGLEEVIYILQSVAGARP